MKLSEFVKMPVRDIYKYLTELPDETFINKPNQIKRPSVIYDNTYIDIYSDETNFGIEVDECGWDVVPVLCDTTYYENIEPEYKYRGNDRLYYANRREYKGKKKLCLRKKSVYGEILFIAFELDRSYYDNELSIVTNNIGLYSKGDNFYPIVLLDDVNFDNFMCGGIPFIFNEKYSFGSNKNEDKKKREQYIKLNNGNKLPDGTNYVYYPVLPSIYNVKTSKFIFDDYAKGLEKYAKNVYEHKDWFDQNYQEKYEHTNINMKKHYKYADKNDKKKVNEKYAHDYISYMSLKYYYNDLTWDDFVAVYEFMFNKNDNVKQYLKKYKCTNITIPHDFFLRWYGSSSEYIVPCWNTFSLDFCLVLPVFKKLDEYRALYQNTGNYESLIHDSKIEYKDKLDPISDEYNKEVFDLYKEIENKVNQIQAKYGKMVDDINEEIKNKYNTVNVNDLKLKTLEIDKKLESFIKRPLSELGVLGTSFDIETIKQKENGLKNTDVKLSELLDKVGTIFKELGDDFTDEYIIIGSKSRAYDAPYEIGEDDPVDVNYELCSILSEHVSEVVANEMLDDIYDLAVECNLGSENIDDGDLYPGWRRANVIYKNLKIDTVEIEK